MSFLSNLSANSSVRKDWKQITSINVLDQAEKESYQKTVVLFKHSTTCGISAQAKHRLEEGYDIDPEKTSLYYLDLLNHRDISIEISVRYDIIHQSPQMIILNNGQATFNTSHHAVSLDTLKENLITD